MTPVADPATWLSLAGRVALVTGGGHGIGRGIAQVLAAAGATVVVSDLDAARAAAVAAEIGGVAMMLDVSDRVAANCAVESTVAQCGALDILVNNAGIFDGFGTSIVDLPDATWDRVRAVNMDGVFHASRAAARAMLAAGRPGRIVNISSTQAFTPGAGIAYDAAKAAVAQMTKSLALDLGRHGITVNAVVPGPIWNRDGPPPDTITLSSQRDDGDPDNPMLASVRSHMARLPLARWGVPEDVGKAVLFLVSDMSPMVTGALLAVDGGWLTL